MNRSEIKIKQCLLYLSLLLLNKEDEDPLVEKKMPIPLVDPDVVLAPIFEAFLSHYPNEQIADSQLIPLFLYSLRFKGDYDHVFRNLWGANGQIAYIKPDLDQEYEIVQPKKAVKVRTLRKASSKAFWSFKEDVNQNLLKGVVYDSESGLQIANSEVFHEHLKDLYKSLFSDDANQADSSIDLVKKMICYLMLQTSKVLEGDELEKFATFGPSKSSGAKEDIAQPQSEVALSTNGGLIAQNFTIYYGPPGTGKTRKARAAIDAHHKHNFKVIQIHPSSSYEDIVEGIKPVTFPNGDVKYEVQDGPIKIMAKKALGAWVKTIASIRHFNIDDTEFLLLNFPVGTISKWFSADETYSLKVSSVDGSKVISQTLKANSDTIKLDIKNDDDRYFWRSLGLTIKTGDESEIEELFTRVEFKGNSWNKGSYAIVLDEMNRGSVASILGELVFAISEARGTHTEADKKAVSLQYSHEEFKWPQNLSLFGTMNSTDVSLDRIDQAIKRRFDFEYVPPEPDLLKVDGLGNRGLDKYLDKLNKVLEDAGIKEGVYNVKDKLIGHSYFIRLKEEIKAGNIVDQESYIGTELKNIWDKQVIQGLLSIFNGSRDELDNFTKNHLREFAPNSETKMIFGWPYLELVEKSNHLKIANG